MAVYLEEKINSPESAIRIRQSRPVLDAVRFSVAFLVFLNLPFWIAARYTDTYPRGWFNIEFIVLGVFAMFTKRWIIWLLLMLDFLGDIAHTSASFYFFSQQDLVHSARFVLALPTARLVQYGLSLSFFAGLWTWLALKIAPRTYHWRKRTLAVAFLAIPLLMVTIDVLDGSNGLLRIRDTKVETKLASGSTISIIRATRLILLGNPGVDFRNVSSASQQFLYLPKLDPNSFRQKEISEVDGPRPNLVLIVFESFGLFRDPAKQELLTSVFDTSDLKERYRIAFDKVPFKGASVSGEFRELCGIWAGVLEHPSSDSLSKRCLPSLLEKQGYETTGLHGFKSYLFGRDVLYPQLGFSHEMFREQMLSTGTMHDCRGAFVGICDSDIAQLISTKLQQKSDKPQFIYWMTLDSHLPVRADVSPKSCGDGSVTINDPDICGWLGLVHRTLSNIAALAATPGLPPTEFIIVGDHAPPFIFQSVRGQFESGFVPTVHLVPRALEEKTALQKQMVKAKTADIENRSAKSEAVRSDSRQAHDSGFDQN